jgi:hypothetical protein
MKVQYSCLTRYLVADKTDCTQTLEPLENWLRWCVGWVFNVDVAASSYHGKFLYCAELPTRRIVLGCWRTYSAGNDDIS